MAARGIKEPEGMKDIPNLRHLGVKPVDNKEDPHYKECWWSKHGHTDPSFGIRAKKTGNKAYRENYDKIKWDK